MPDSSHEHYHLLTREEARLTQLMAQGKTPLEIAIALGEPVARVREQLTGLAARLRAW
jgi:DNA-binding CsgD family transcriptional regulator